jgi:hypothetical protein
LLAAAHGRYNFRHPAPAMPARPSPPPIQRLAQRA